MAAVSYDQLLRQVEVLKMENSTLRQELQDNSNHLTKLETEALNMKEVLKQLQGSIEDESGEASGSQMELIERLKGECKRGLRRQRAGSSDSSDTGRCFGSIAVEKLQTDWLLILNRALLLAELEKEEKEKGWYYAQLQNLTKRIDSLPLTENFTLQTDMSRRQLEFEARQIRSAMEEQLGSCQEMERRAQARVSRIQQIEKDILRLGAHIQVSSSLLCPPANHQPPGNQGSSPSSVTAFHVDLVLMSALSLLQVEMVYSLLSMLGTHDKDDMSRTLLAMSSSQDSCIAMRQSGCLPLLIQLLHGNDKDSLLLGNSRGSKEARARASAALHNIVHSQPDDKRGRREIRVLHLLEQVRHYCEACWSWQENHERGVDQEENPMPSPVEHQICPAVCVLMKLSFDEEHRHAMNELGVVRYGPVNSGECLHSVQPRSY
uniref:Adenomatous polyposis coli N-terminal dimerisation domain-containing protein n=1 Tax=Oryzias melastigma TaxID=30732 RepID=A0A3B3DVM8_ORYME